MNCTKTIPLDDDIFARLDHFQEHEFASRISQAKARHNSTNIANTFKSFTKKRGRPPKTSAAFPGMFSEDLGQYEKIQRNPQQLRDSTV